ncbi:MAG: type II secretion system minor pseudopilin GspK [Gammaproteobacteria bacterium]|nr:type II secretion system minor pseudopilin GspK [Gammaproteobacteria bacterium]
MACAHGYEIGVCEREGRVLIGTQRGIALISILLMVVLFSALAFQLYSHQTMVTAQTRIGLSANQARYSLLASEALAQELLYVDWLDEDGRIRDDMAEPWAQPLAPLNTVSGDVRVQIVDLSGKLNLNSLAGVSSKESTKALSYILNRIGVSSELTPVWRDWIDADDQRFQIDGYQGREELDWLGNDTPFRTPNRLAGHLSEIQVLAPFTPEVYSELTLLATVLPTNVLKINVNTAHPEVLNSLLPPTGAKMSPRGGVRNFGSVEAFIDLHSGFSEIRDQLSVRSDFFEVRATLDSPDLRMDMTSQIFRDPTSGECRIYARDFGSRHIWES